MRARRRPLLDEYLEDDELVVFVPADDPALGGHVVALSPVATAALMAIQPPGSTLTEISAAVVSSVGPPPAGVDPLAVTRQVLATLEDAGIVSLTERDPGAG